MDMQGTRPFHLHYHVPDVEYAEQVLTDIGLPLRARFGTVDGEMVAVEAGEQSPDGFRFRLQDAQRGYANVTLTSGKEVQFDHFGVVTSSARRFASDVSFRVDHVPVDMNANSFKGP